MEKRKRRIRRLPILVCCLTGLCLSQTGKKVQAGSRAGADALSRTCSPEFDDPASAEYKQCTQAIQLLEQLSVQQPHDVSIFLTLGRVYANRSHEKSIRAYQRALAMDPKNVTANFELGMLLPSPEDRIQHLRAGIRAEPMHPEAHGRLAALLAANSQTKEALVQVKQQIGIDPSRTDIIANVMKTLTDKGHKREAAQILATYLRSNLPQQDKCEVARYMVKEYAEQPDVLKTFDEQCPGYKLPAGSAGESVAGSPTRR